MEFFKNFDWSAKSIAKIVGVILLGIVALAIGAALISFAFRTITNVTTTYHANFNGAGVSGGGGYAPSSAVGGPEFSKDMALTQNSYAPGYAPSPIIPPPNFSTGNNAEKYEVKSYTATYKSRNLDETCDAIMALKIKTYVIFETSNKNEDNCYYRFKVSKDHTDEIVKVIEGLKPDVLNVNIQSIKSQIQDIEDTLDILKKKLASVEDTLQTAQSAYDEISQLATRQKDADTLAKIIDSKLSLIERLTQERMDINSQIDSYNQSKSDQMDQLDYSFFDITVNKDVIFDWKQIKDSWNYETQLMVTNVNQVLETVTVNLVTYLVRFVQVVIYLFVSVLLLKFVWLGVKRIWKGDLLRSRKI